MAHDEQVHIDITHTRVTLKKYDGDLPQPGEPKEPAETIIIEDGVVIEPQPTDEEK